MNYVDKLSARSTGICPRCYITQPITEHATRHMAIGSKMFDYISDTANSLFAI